MKKLYKNQAGANQFGGTPPYGNLTVLTFTLKSDINGNVEGFKDKVDSTDELVVGYLPEGFTVMDAILIAPSTPVKTKFNVGIRCTKPLYESAPLDLLTYIFTAADFGVGGVGRVNMTKAGGHVMKENVELVITPQDAISGVTDVVLHVIGELTGPK